MPDGSSTSRSTASRPDVNEIKKAYDYLFGSGSLISKIKDSALRGRLFSDSPVTGQRNDVDEGGSSQNAGVVGRSLAWKLFLIQTEPLQPQSGENSAIPPLQSLQQSRQEYRRLLLEKMRAPDGGYEEGFVIPGTGSSPSRTTRADKNLEMNNPLSLHDNNPWNAWFASMDLRKEILQDVERTFPDIGYFRDQHVQGELTNILFLYAVTHADIGYRQGMHELLAPLYYAVDFDSLSTSESSSQMEVFVSRAWVAADAWVLFSAVMRGVGRWYEWREPKLNMDPTGSATTPTSGINHGRSPLASHVQLNLSNSDGRTPGGLQPYVAPIVETCNRIQSVLLKSVDPQLWKSLQTSGIEPQMYGIRWLRLLFTREFSMDDSMTLWDGLFACDPSFELVPWICVAMLIRIRNNLIPADYSTQLTYLLRYPSSATGLSSSTPPPVHPCALLLRQALTLQMSPTVATGATVNQENFNLLNIPIEIPEATPPMMRRRAASKNQPYPTSEAGPSSRGPLTPDNNRMHFKHGSASMGIPEMIARGLLERGESLGINKTVMNAVSEFKRNLPDLANTLQRLPTPMTTHTSSYAAYPLVDEKPPTERPPWEPRTRFEMEKDISQLQVVQHQLGDSVAWIVDTLLLDDGESADKNADQTKSVKERKREAIESLAYVRDVLKGIVPSTQVEEDRLFAEDEVKKRQKQSKKGVAEATASATSITPNGPVRKSSDSPPQLRTTLTPPKPAAMTLPRFPSHSSAPVKRAQDYFSTGPSASRSPPRSSPLPSFARPKEASPSPVPPTGSVLAPNKASVPLAPWNYTPSAFSSSSTLSLPRMPSKPSAVVMPRQHSTSGTPRASPPYSGTSSASQTPSGSDQPPPAVASSQQDPLGVLR
ncbi:hypothetical protein BDY19DRAFT_959591 [Irpex rosettiformis]|uniref:Uncharacterized protein n=1 Tax=Irpex rosettiformis TaxID=378272 RepID=A0ACB8TX77_9APHY|nr:hypothetical protein BDY19DRAFT_959591 [Irpex rosettiformis]